MATCLWRDAVRVPNHGGRDVEPNAAALAERLLSFDALLENMTEGFAMCEAIWAGADLTQINAPQTSSQEGGPKQGAPKWTSPNFSSSMASASR